MLALAWTAPGSTPAAVNWGTGTNTIFGPDGTTPLTASRDDAVGCFVQLLNAGPNGQIDPINPGTATGAGGDDFVVDAAWLGASTISPVNGKLTTQSEAHVPGHSYYIRAWNAPTPNPQGGSTTGFGLSDGNEAQAPPLGTATHYGNSILLATPAAGNQSDNLQLMAGIVTNLPASPDPELTLVTSGGQNVVAQPTVTFPRALVGGTGSVTFSLGNAGPGILTVASIQAFGEFTVTPPPVNTVDAGAAAAFTVTFTPTTNGVRNGVLQIQSNDPVRSNLFVTLTGRGFAPAADDDGDGVSNSAEFGLAGMGFDPEIGNASLVTALRTHGFFQAGSIGDLALGRPVVQRDPATGNVRLVVGPQRSTSLSAWAPLTNFSVTTSAQNGTLQLEFPAAGPAEFYRIWAAPPGQ